MSLINTGTYPVVSNTSKEALVARADIDRFYMGGIERSEHNLAIINLLNIPDALEAKASKLLNETGN